MAKKNESASSKKVEEEKRLAESRCNENENPRPACICCCCCGHEHDRNHDCGCDHNEHHGHHDINYSVQRVVETCTFEIFMTRIKAGKNDWFDGKTELMITGYADGVSSVFPGMSTWFTITENWDWVNIYKKVATITIQKGSQRQIAINADAIECDGWGAGRWEIGSGRPELLTIECGELTGAAYVHVNIHKPTRNAPKSTEVDIEFRAFQITP